MGRHKLADPPVETKISVPLSLRTQVEWLLYSEAEGRVPLGELSRFFVEAVRERIARMELANAKRAGTVGGYRDGD